MPNPLECKIENSSHIRTFGSCASPRGRQVERARRSIAALDDDDRAAAFPTGTPRALKALLAPDHATPAASPDKHRDDEGGDSEATPRYDDGETDRRPAEPSWRGPGLLLHSPPKPRGSAVLAPIVP